MHVSSSATKFVANKKLSSLLSDLLSATDVLPVYGEYKLWLYHNYIVSLLRFHLSVDAVTPAVTLSLEVHVSSSATKFVANKKLSSLLSDLLSATDVLPVYMESISFGSIIITLCLYYAFTCQ